MLQSRDEAWRASECEVMVRLMHDGVSAFERASAGGVRLDNVLASAPSDVQSTALDDALGCDDISRAAADALPSQAGGSPAALARSSCAASNPSPRGSRGRLGACLVALLLWRRGAARRRLRLRPNSDIPALE
jgi:hypothetical protein